MKILILYTEIAGYVMACVREFTSLYPDVEVHIVRYPINKEAPFDIQPIKGLTTYNRDSFDKVALINLAKEINPDLVLCSGWIDKDYLSTVKSLSAKVNKVMVLDNHWNGSLKQMILRLISPFVLKSYFNYVWVPGLPQSIYAQKLGFRVNQILTGFYSGDVSLFKSFYDQFKSQKEQQMPKRFICVARYIEAKNLQLLWDAFIELYESGELKNWQLYCVGIGEGFESKREHPAIHHKGFIQPQDMSKIVGETSVFVLPSMFEPWGVVVHEFAAAGFPMLISKNVGAASEFIISGQNGYLFDPKNKQDLKEKLILFAGLSDQKLQEMSNKSVELSQKISTQKWAHELKKLLK